MAAKEISVKKYVVRLSGEERGRLEALIRKGKSPAQRLPQAPEGAAQRWAARQRWRERQRARNATQHPTARPHAAMQTPAQESADWSRAYS